MKVIASQSADERKVVHQERLRKNRVHQIIKMMDAYNVTVEDITDAINQEESEYNQAKLFRHRNQLKSKKKVADALKLANEAKKEAAKVKREQREAEKAAKLAAKNQSLEVQEGDGE